MTLHHHHQQQLFSLELKIILLFFFHPNTSFYFQEDQTFPRQALHQKQTSIPVKEQQTEVITPAIVSSPIEKNLHTSNKIERRK
jgi:hypothetical protein